MNWNEIKKWKWLTLYEPALNLYQGKKVTPRMAIIHPTNRCNHHCPDCEYSYDHCNQPAELTTQNLISCIDQLTKSGVSSVLLSGGGEPTLHPDIAFILSYLNEKHFRVGLFTNGSNLEQVLSAVIAKTCSFVRVSVDAATPATYTRVRGLKDGSTKFQRLSENLRMLLDTRNRLNSKMQISLKFLVSNENWHEMEGFVEFAEKFAIDQIQFKPLRMSTSMLNETEMTQASAILSKLSANTQKISITGSLPAAPKVLTPCWLSPLRMIIDATGDVFMCNYFRHRRESHRIGNMLRETLDDLWFGARHRQLLSSIDSSECELFDCRFHALNFLLKEAIDQHRDTFDFI